MEVLHFLQIYASHAKGRDIEKIHVSLLFFWKELQRQVRIDGTVEFI